MGQGLEIFHAGVGFGKETFPVQCRFLVLIAIYRARPGFEFAIYRVAIDLGLEMKWP